MPFSKSEIARFPAFAEPQNITGMMIGNDIDALLSASFLHDRYGWPVTAVYNYRTIFFDAQFSKTAFVRQLHSGAILAVDLDIAMSSVPSIGHHILQIKSSDFLPALRLCLNPNLLRGISRSEFQSKYPLATIHFLMWLFDDYPPEVDRVGELLLWLADSVYINGQSHRFRNNVRQWLREFVPNRLLLEVLDDIDHREFEYDMKEMLIPALKNCGMQKGVSHVWSHHLGLSGYQGQWENPVRTGQVMDNVFDLIHRHTGWRKPILPSEYQALSGKREIIELGETEFNLAHFIQEREIFSYAITGHRALNYTAGFSW